MRKVQAKKKPSSKSARSSDLKLSIDKSLVILKQPDGVMVIRENDHDTFFQIKGRLASETFERFRKTPRLEAVIEQMKAAYPEAPVQRLQKDITKLAQKLLRHKLFVRT